MGHALRLVVLPKPFRLFSGAYEIERIAESDDQRATIAPARILNLCHPVGGQIDFIVLGQELPWMEGIQEDAVEEHYGCLKDVEEPLMSN